MLEEILNTNNRFVIEKSIIMFYLLGSKKRLICL